MKKKILIVFGTRPELIKLISLIKDIERSNQFDLFICNTGQHTDLIFPLLDIFKIKPHYNLNVMEPNQPLATLNSKILSKVSTILDQLLPDLVIVHGDTTTAFSASLAAFYYKIPVSHVEAGLRTNDIYAPYPEEFNRQAISLIAKFHYAPTEAAKKSLINEGKKESNIIVTGNTGIDSLKYTINKDFDHPVLAVFNNKKIVLVTIHRRENYGHGFSEIFNAIIELANMYEDILFIYPVHPNPNVKELAFRMLSNQKNIKLTPPFDVVTFHNLMARSFLIMTDSGGIQEEAPSLNLPVMVLRENTERYEGVENGNLILVGTNKESIINHFNRLYNDNNYRNTIIHKKNPYGDGKASEHILKHLMEIFE